MMMDAFFPFSETTDGVTVRVSATFLPEQSDVDSLRWFWAYHIRVENHRDSAVQLLTRHWLISDARGGLHKVDGEGVIGEQPHIAPGQTFSYTSGAILETEVGSMRGSYQMIGEDGTHFDAHVPMFTLAVPHALH